MSITSSEGTSCCGMNELSGFYNGGRRKDKWLHAILMCEDYDDGRLQGIYVFTGAEQQRGSSSPFSFARWLEKQGEELVKTKPTVNPNSKNKITAFLWAPSEAFRKRYEEFRKEEEEKDNEESDRYDHYYGREA